MYLTAFMIFSITIHGAGFYLFKVVYPTPTRVEPTMHSVSVLDEMDPQVRSLFQRLKDRTVYLKLPSEQSDVRIRLEDYEVRFTPSFQSAAVEPLEPVFPWSLEFKAPPVVELPEISKEVSAMNFDDDLKGRGVAPWSILNDYLSRADSVPAFRARLEVSEQGAVKVIGIEAEMEEASRGELIEVIESTLRFLPAEQPTTGWMDVWARG